MTDNRIELSRGVGTAPSYGKSMRSVGADQAKTVVVATAHKASLARITGSHGSRTMIRRLAWARRTTVRLAVAQEAPDALCDGVDSTIIGSGASSWWSSRDHTPRGGELGCEDEDAPQRSAPALAAHGDVDAGQSQHHRLGRFRLARFGFRLSEQRSAQSELSSPPPIGEHSVVAQPGEAAREHVQEEASDELTGVERHHLDLVAVRVVAPAEPHSFAVEVDEAVVGDGAFVGVAPEVGEDVGGAGERRLGVDDPLVRLQETFRHSNARVSSGSSSPGMRSSPQR